MVSELSTSRTIRAADKSGEKLLMSCSTPLSNGERSFAVIGFADPFARVATTFMVVVAAPVGCARRPACANKGAIKLAEDKTHNSNFPGRRVRVTTPGKLP